MQKEIKRTLSSKAMAAVWDGENPDDVATFSPREQRIRKATFNQVNAAPFYSIFFKMVDRNNRTVTGTYEIDCDRMNYDNIVRDIADGQYENIDRIFHCIPGGLCEDVTHDTAIDVEALLLKDGYDPSEYSIGSWIEDHLGGFQVSEGRSDYAEHNVLNRAQQGV